MPSALLDARRIVARHGDHNILDRVDLRVDATSRIGLLGANGSGKSTLLTILAGHRQPDAGTVARYGSVGYLPQLTGPDEHGRTVRAVIAERVGLSAAARALDAAADRLAADCSAAAIAAHTAALERWLTAGGADADARLTSAADAAGLDRALLDRPLRTLSGGQVARAGLAALTIARCDVILLDEPTNHLDDDGLARLTQLLAGRGGIVLVSHDRALFAAVATELCELDRRTGSASHYSGGWDAYEREREHARARAEAAHREAVDRRAELAAAEREMRRRAAASAGKARRPVHDNDKHSREWVRMRAEEMQGRARSVGTRAARIEVPDKPWQARELRLTLTAAERRGDAVVTLSGAACRREAWTLGPLDLALAPGERLLIAGPNGAGKSTLIGMLAGRIELAEGARRLPPGAVVAELGQARGGLDADARLVDALRQRTGLTETGARTALAGFGLGAELAERPVATLSPGELTRAELTLVAHRRAGCLLLDEPTNHLDVESLEVLEAALDSWPGALAVATHDERLKRGLRLDAELVLEAGRPGAISSRGGGRGRRPAVPRQR